MGGLGGRWDDPKPRQEPVFHGSYPLHWVGYSRVADGSAGTFRCVFVEAR